MFWVKTAIVPDWHRSRRLTQIPGQVKKPGMLGHCEAGLFSALKLPTGAMATATLLIVLMEEKPLAGAGEHAGGDGGLGA
jgi:hypothetical protein